MAFYKASNKKGESRMINLEQVSHTYEEVINEERHYFVALNSGTILPVTKEDLEAIESALLAK